MTTNKQTRRAFLTGIGATVAVTLAGCTTETETENPNTRTDTNSDPTTTASATQTESATASPTPEPTGTPDADASITWGDVKAVRSTDYSGDPTLELVGRLTVNRDFEELYVVAYWYDDSGARIGNEGLDLAENLREGETWEFTITFYGEHASADDVVDWRLMAEWF